MTRARAVVFKAMVWEYFLNQNAVAYGLRHHMGSLGLGL
jgi:hypothetical protein